MTMSFFFEFCVYLETTTGAINSDLSLELLLFVGLLLDLSHAGKS